MLAEAILFTLVILDKPHVAVHYDSLPACVLAGNLAVTKETPGTIFECTDRIGNSWRGTAMDPSSEFRERLPGPFRQETLNTIPAIGLQHIICTPMGTTPPRPSVGRQAAPRSRNFTIRS